MKSMSSALQPRNSMRLKSGWHAWRAFLHDVSDGAGEPSLTSEIDFSGTACVYMAIEFVTAKVRRFGIARQSIYFYRASGFAGHAFAILVCPNWNYVSLDTFRAWAAENPRNAYMPRPCMNVFYIYLKIRGEKRLDTTLVRRPQRNVSCLMLCSSTTKRLL